MGVQQFLRRVAMAPMEDLCGHDLEVWTISASAVDRFITLWEFLLMRYRRLAGMLAGVGLCMSVSLSGKILMLDPVAGTGQKLVVYKGQIRVVEDGYIKFYASCLPTTDKDGVATIEIGVANDTFQPIAINPVRFQLFDSRGKSLPLLTREKALRVIQHQEEALEASIRRMRAVAQNKVEVLPTLDELVGSPRAQSARDKMKEKEMFGHATADPERKQKYYAVEAEVRYSVDLVRRAALRKKRMVKEYYLKELVLEPDLAFNGIVMVRLPNKRVEWVQLDLAVEDETPSFKFNVSR